MVEAPPAYVLRFPFRIAAGQKFSNLETALDWHCGKLKVRFSEHYGWYHLVIEPFPSESAATSFIPRVYAGLMWVLLHRGLSSEASTNVFHKGSNCNRKTPI